METRLGPEEICSSLQQTGYLVINLKSLDEYYAVCEEIGEIRHKLDVRLKKDSKIYANIEGKVPFHTDNPHIPIVAWHCVRPDQNDGSNLLINGRLITEKLSADDISTLTCIRLPVPYTDGDHPMLGLDPYHVYWLPRMVEEAKERLSEMQLLVIQRFYKALMEVYESAMFERVTLNMGDTLFVNNWVMLHGRNELPGDSERYLVRAYIQPTYSRYA